MTRAHDSIVYWFPTAVGPDSDVEPPHSRQWYLMRALSREVPVVLVTRSRSTARSTRFRHRVEVVDDLLTVVYGGFGLTDAERLRRFRPLLARVDALRLRFLLARQGYRRPLYWLGVNDAAYARRELAPTLVYDCIDPCFIPAREAEHDRQERQIAQRAALVFATAETLRDKMEMLHERVHLLPNAYAPSSATADAADHEGPIGFMGVLDERIDWDFLSRCAQAVPERTLLLVGRINPSQAQSAQRLREAHPNVVLTGEVQLQEGKKLSESFAVGLVPFREGLAGDSINPVKMYMHLGSGTPVVGTRTNELLLVGAPLVYTAGPGEEGTVLRQVLAEPADAPARTARRAFAQRNTWDDRAKEALRVLRQEGLLK